jgi:type IV secretion system protein VirD4
MMGRPLMTSDELKALPKGNFIVTKTGTHPMRTKLELFFKWGIVFDAPYEVKEHAAREVKYADAKQLEAAIIEKYPPKQKSAPASAPTPDVPAEPKKPAKQPDEKSAVRLD